CPSCTPKQRTQAGGPPRFFFSSRRRHTRSDRDWSSDVCSSDLGRCAGETLRSPRQAALERPSTPTSRSSGLSTPVAPAQQKSRGGSRPLGAAISASVFVCCSTSPYITINSAARPDISEAWQILHIIDRN